MVAPVGYQIQRTTVSQGYDRRTCWVQARAGAIPSAAPGQNPTVVLTMQKAQLHGSDLYEAIHSLRSTDLGQTWTTPVEQETFRRELVVGNDGRRMERVVCDFWPKWHSATGTLLGTGHTGYYLNGHGAPNPPCETAYAVYDQEKHLWNDWHTLRMPDEQKFFAAGAGCTQRVDLPDGEILLPIYFKIGEPHQFAATVVRCAFDGTTMEYLEHGTELTVPIPHGFAEPSLAHYRGRFFLTLRNVEEGYVAVSDDGLHFGEPQRWRFDDGELLGNYNTQQHWVTHSDGLFLVYTRRGLNNDHVFRYRAPLVMAQVDPERLCVLRETEQVIIPERGARLGNFGITEVYKKETWVVETEWMQNSREFAEIMLQKLRAKLSNEEVYQLAATPNLCGACEQFGSDNTVWTARVLWNRPNNIYT